MKIIKEINIENFKCFKKFTIKTGKLTILTGANSSGKSSILYSILGLIQSGEFPMQFSPSGKYVSMGDFGDIVYLHDSSKKIKIKYNYIFNDIDYTLETIWEEDKLNKLPTLSFLSAKSNFYDLEISKRYKYNVTFKYFIDKDPLKKLHSPEIFTKLFTNFKEISTEFKKDKNESKENNGIDDLILSFKSPRKTLKFSTETLEELSNQTAVKGSYYFETFLRSIITDFIQFDNRVNFISSFRLLPERTYYETSKTNLKIGKSGENYVDQIILWESRKSKELNKLKETIRELGLFYDIKTVRLGGSRYELLVKGNKNGIWASISDVGFGISQFLPIIVADIQLGDNSTLFIAQPEIHLHPSIQALFANYLINNINNNEKTYYIETHSEYLINRLRLEIVKGNFKSNDVKTYFIDNNGDKAKSHKLRFLKNGQIKNAPKSFFETYLMDSMDITLEALK